MVNPVRSEKMTGLKGNTRQWLNQWFLLLCVKGKETYPWGSVRHLPVGECCPPDSHSIWTAAAGSSGIPCRRGWGTTCWAPCTQHPMSWLPPPWTLYGESDRHWNKTHTHTNHLSQRKRHRFPQSLQLQQLTVYRPLQDQQSTFSSSGRHCPWSPGGVKRYHDMRSDRMKYDMTGEGATDAVKWNVIPDGQHPTPSRTSGRD